MGQILYISISKAWLATACTCVCCTHHRRLASRPAHFLSCRRAYPSLLWLHGSLGLTAEAALAALCCLGWLLSAAAAWGAAHPLVFAGAWVTYFSFRSLGGPFVEYGWVRLCCSNSLAGSKQQPSSPAHLPASHKQQHGAPAHISPPMAVNLPTPATCPPPDAAGCPSKQTCC